MHLGVDPAGTTDIQGGEQLDRDHAVGSLRDPLAATALAHRVAFLEATLQRRLAARRHAIDPRVADASRALWLDLAWSGWNRPGTCWVNRTGIIGGWGVVPAGGVPLKPCVLGEVVEKGIWHDATVSRLPRSNLERGNSSGVADFRLAHDRALATHEVVSVLNKDRG